MSIEKNKLDSYFTKKLSGPGSYSKEIANENTTSSTTTTSTTTTQNQIQTPNLETESEDESNETMYKTITKSITPLNLGTNSPNQPIINFPKKSYNGHLRSFQSDWYKKFSWLDYSVNRDSVFCFACRNFSMLNTSDPKFVEDIFINIGFNNWKSALSKDKGFYKHEKIASHIRANAAWLEKQERDKSGTTINILLGSKQVENKTLYKVNF